MQFWTIQRRVQRSSQFLSSTVSVGLVRYGITAVCSDAPLSASIIVCKLSLPRELLKNILFVDVFLREILLSLIPQIRVFVLLLRIEFIGIQKLFLATGKIRASNAHYLIKFSIRHNLKVCIAFAVRFTNQKNARIRSTSSTPLSDLIRVGLTPLVFNLIKHPILNSHFVLQKFDLIVFIFEECLIHVNNILLGVPEYLFGG